MLWQLIVLWLAFGAPASQAASIPVVNGSFEDPVLADGSVLASVGSPWTVSFSSGASPPLTENPAGVGAGVVDGGQRVRLRTSSLGFSMIMRQTLAATYQPNTSYVFSITPVDIEGSITVPNFQLALDGPAFNTFQPNEVLGALGQEVSVSATILPGDPFIGEPVQIVVSVFSDSFGTVSFDRARARSFAIPQPSTALLVGLGLVGLGSEAKRPRFLS